MAFRITSRRTTFTFQGSQEKKREQESERLFEEIIAENFSNLRKEPDIQVQEAQRAPKKLNPKRSTTIHIIIKWSKLRIKRES